jgi:hypothetical protein
MQPGERDDRKRRRADQEKLPPADTVAKRAHDQERAGGKESVDIYDPKKLRRRRPQISRHRRDR